MDYIAYYRVSTDKQGESGLGLEAQEHSVREYIAKTGSRLITSFIEIESGKSTKNRPYLHEALKACKKHRATLIIAKLDRLARNVHFISGLLDTKIPFMAVDNPHANKLTCHMMAVIAEHERDMISQRVKDALWALKKRGVVLGRAGKVRAAENKQKANTFAQATMPIINEIMERDIVTYRGIADELNRLSVPTFRPGSKWDGSRVFNLIKRIDALSAA